MDRINGLSDDLLLKILTFLPTKVAVSTSTLSKRWEFLWMWLPKLEYISRSVSEPEKGENLRCFLEKTLPLHRAPVIESFRLGLTYVHFKPEDIKLWVAIAVSHHLRELEIDYNTYPNKESLLPSSLYACKSLVSLKLRSWIYLDIPRMVSLPSLKTLVLQYLVAVDPASFKQLLSTCPVLENLSVHYYFTDISFTDTLRNVSVSVPSLQSLSLAICDYYDPKIVEIDTPSLKYLKLEDRSKDTRYISVEKMPKLEVAYVAVRSHGVIESLVGTLTSVKRLTLCCPKAAYNKSFVFKQLEHLKLCDCTDCWSNLLAPLLKDSPNLQVLDIFQMHGHGGSNMVSWNEPSSVPKCFLSTLQTFNWSGFVGRPQNIDVVVYILMNACRLKTATLSFDNRKVRDKSQMIEELSRSSRASSTCQLILD